MTLIRLVWSLVSSFAIAGPHPWCDATLSQFYGGQTEAELLAKFDPSLIEAGSLVRLSGGTYAVKIGDVQYVVRLSDKLTPADFESFASAFVRAAPGGTTPVVRPLTPTQTSRVLDRIDEIGGPHARSILEKDPRRVTVAVYYPIETGQQFLTRLKLGEHWHRLFLNFGGLADSEVTSSERSSRRTVWKGLSESPNVSAEAVIAKLRPLGGRFASISVENYKQLLDRFFAEGNPSELRPLFDDGIAAVPADVRRQLADHWILATVLGIPDFHVGNWLIHEGQVLQIDVAMRTTAFLNGTADPALGKSQHFPFFGARSDSMRRRMVDWSSPALRSYLESLSVDDINGLAKGSGLRINAKQTQGIRDRISELYRLR